jgi:hypothetical protein
VDDLYNKKDVLNRKKNRIPINKQFFSTLLTVKKLL